MAKAKQPVSINSLEFDALITEQIALEATVPEYAVEKGYTVSDAVILNAEKLSMTLFVTNMPVTWYQRHGSDPSRVEQVVKQLKQMYFAKEPVKIVTSDATYTNMAIESLTISKTAEIGYAREIPITFKKINITEATKTTIPSSYGKSGATGASVGTANTSTETSSGNSSDSSESAGSDDGSKSSILYSAASSLGLIP